MKHRTYTTIISLCLCIFLLLGFLFPTGRFFAVRTAKADTPTTGTYACILEEDTFFYSTPDESRGLFLLPKSYYVQLLEYGDEYSKIEYLYDDAQAKKLIGYAKTATLTFVDYIPERPYFYHVFELNYRIDEGSEVSSDFLTQITLSCTYYGDYKVGSKTYCYVLRGEAFGYVPRPADLTVRENTEYAEHLAAAQPPTSSEESKPEKSSSPAQIAILVALCLLVPLLAALILKPPRRPPYELDE